MRPERIMLSQTHGHLARQRWFEATRHIEAWPVPRARALVHHAAHLALGPSPHARYRPANSPTRTRQPPSTSPPRQGQPSPPPTPHSDPHPTQQPRSPNSPSTPTHRSPPTRPPEANRPDASDEPRHAYKADSATEPTTSDVPRRERSLHTRPRCPTRWMQSNADPSATAAEHVTRN